MSTDQSQRTRMAQDTLRKRHPVISRGDADHLRMRVLLMLLAGIHRCSQQVPYMYKQTHVRLRACVCVHVFVCASVSVCIHVCVSRC